MSDYSISQPVWEGERPPLAKALAAAQKASEAIKKAATNPAFGGSKYADLATVVEAVIPALNAAGVAVLQFPTFDGTMVGVTTTMIHESGASVSSTLLLRPSKSDPQGVGSATTYARRYSLLAMTGAAPEDDDGNAASGPRHEPERQHVEPPKQTLAQRADAFAAKLRAARSPADLDKTFKLGSGLMADLDAKDPDRFAELTALHEQLAGAFAAHLEAAE
jgi:hypothetical protein